MTPSILNRYSYNVTTVLVPTYHYRHTDLNFIAIKKHNKMRRIEVQIDTFEKPVTGTTQNFSAFSVVFHFIIQTMFIVFKISSLNFIKTFMFVGSMVGETQSLFMTMKNGNISPSHTPPTYTSLLYEPLKVLF